MSQKSTCKKDVSIGVDKPIAKDKARKKEGIQRVCSLGQTRESKEKVDVNGCHEWQVSCSARRLKKKEEDGGGGTEGGYL